MTSDIDITLHVCTYTCVFRLIDIHKIKTVIPNITAYTVAMATLPLHVQSTSKFLAITLIRTADNETKFVWKVLISRCVKHTFSLTNIPRTSKAVLLLWFLTVLAVCVYTLVQLLC